MKPYFADDHVELYHGDMREVIHELDITADACVTDPPYGDTSLVWDRWPAEWPLEVAHKTNSLWCFGSMTMFFARLTDFVDAGWRMSQDIVWEKHNGSGFMKDRFRRVHEHALHWYRGPWAEIYHEVPRYTVTFKVGRQKGARIQAGESRTTQTGAIGAHTYVEDGERLARSVIFARSMHRRAIHPTEKPGAIIDPLIRYSVPPGGLVLDPFAGSGSTLLTARSLGRRAVGIEADERYCEAAARRLDEADLLTLGGAP